MKEDIRQADLKIDKAIQINALCKNIKKKVRVLKKEYLFKLYDKQLFKKL